MDKAEFERKKKTIEKQRDNELKAIYAQFGKNAIDLAEDRAKSMLRIVELHFQNRTGTLKDLFKVVLALLGGNLTVLTVNANVPGLIKNPLLTTIGVLLLFLTGVYVFISQKRYGVHLENSNLKVNANRVQLITAAQNVIMNSLDERTQADFSNALNSLGKEKEIDTIPRVYEFSDTYAGVAVLIGAVLSSLALIDLSPAYNHVINILDILF